MTPDHLLLLICWASPFMPQAETPLRYFEKVSSGIVRYTRAADGIVVDSNEQCIIEMTPSVYSDPEIPEEHITCTTAYGAAVINEDIFGYFIDDYGFMNWTDSTGRRVIAFPSLSCRIENIPPNE